MKNLLAIVILILVIITFWNSCNHKKEKEALISQLSNYQLSEQKFTIKVKSDSSTIAQQKQTILTQDEALKLGLLKIQGDINKVQSQVTQIANFKKDSFPIPFLPDHFADTSGWYAKLKMGDTSKAIIDSLIANSIVVPKPFAYNERYFTIGGKVNKKGLLLDSIRIPNQTRVTIGTKKSGFLNLKREPIVEVSNSNPYIMVSKINNVTIKQSKPFYESKAFLIGVGIVGGYYIKSKIN